MANRDENGKLQLNIDTNAFANAVTQLTGMLPSSVPNNTTPAGASPTTATTGLAPKDPIIGEYIAQVPGDPRTTAADKQTKTVGMYTDEQQQADLNTHSGRQGAIVDDFAMSPEQWYKMYGYWNWNLAQNNPNGNLNRRSYSNTLRNSRLADALNNKRHWRGAKIGRRTNSSFGTNEYTPGYSERWEPIETQEMRQMRANERLDEKARGRQIDRAENIQDYPLELQKMADKMRSDLAAYTSKSGIDLQRAMQAGVWKAEYGDSWQTYWSNFMTQFARELDVDIKDRVMSKLSRLSYPFSQMYSNLFSGGTVPSPIITTMWQYLQNIAATGTTEKEKAALYTGGLISILGMLGNATTGATFDMFTGGLPGLQ